LEKNNLLIINFQNIGGSFGFLIIPINLDEILTISDNINLNESSKIVYA
jgi:hypothetical protein